MEELNSRTKTIPMNQLAKEIKKQTECGKYCILFDQVGTISTYFKYKETIVDFYKYKVANECHLTEGHMEKNEVFEELRRKLTHSMNEGTIFCINIDNMIPDFKNEWTDSELFPLDSICDFELWRENENYMQIVKEEERTEINSLGLEQSN